MENLDACLGVLSGVRVVLAVLSGHRDDVASIGHVVITIGTRINIISILKATCTELRRLWKFLPDWTGVIGRTVRFSSILPSSLLNSII